MIDFFQQQVHGFFAYLLHRVAHGLDGDKETVVQRMMKLDQRDVFRDAQEC